MEFTNILIIVSAVVVIFLLWVIVGVRHLKNLKRDIVDYWENVDKHLRRRQDLVPNLIETVRDYTDEQEVIMKELIHERRVAALAYNPGARKIELEYDLTRRINKVFDLGRVYKDLSKDTNFLELRKDVDDLEKEILNEQKKYNGKVRTYNKHRNFIFLRPLSAVFNFAVADIFEVER